MPKREAQGRRTQDNSVFYNSHKWRKFRKRILAIEPLCRSCKTDNKVTEATVLDHITPIRQGGAKLSRDNVQPLCSTCHAKKSGQEAHTRKKG
ncbi:MAG: HNH endonuclease [Flavobacteriaceae bacterium]